MKVVRYIVIALLAVVSVAVGVWTLATGMAAPESKKIADNSPLVQNVATTQEGIEELGVIFANQVEVPSDVDELELNKAKAKEYTLKVAEQQEAYLLAKQELENLDPKRQKKAYEEASKIVADYEKAQADLKTYEENIKINTDNIATYEKAKAEANTESETIVALCKAVNGTMIWCYVLLVFAVIIILFSLVMGWIQDPRKLISACVLLVIGAAVVGIAYYIASTHGWEEGDTLKDAKGYDLGIGSDPTTRVPFGPFEYMISDISIWVAYIVGGLAVLAAGFSVIRGFFKS